MTTAFQGMKKCTGPAHPGPVYLPTTEEHWYFHKIGKRAGLPIGRCKLCVNYHRLRDAAGESGTVECKRIRPYANELLLRHGSTELASKRSGVAETTFTNIMKNDQCSVQKRTARKIIVALDDKRREDRRIGSTSDQFIKARRAQALAQERMNFDY